MARKPMKVTKPKRKRAGKKYTGPKNNENLFHFEIDEAFLDFLLPKKASAMKKKAKKQTRRRHNFKKGHPHNSSKY